MNCLLEAVASVYLHTRKRLVPDPVEEEIYTAQVPPPCPSAPHRRADPALSKRAPPLG